MQRLEEESFAPAQDWTLVIQFLIRHYADWATHFTPVLSVDGK
jgi:hypothetical protein